MSYAELWSISGGMLGDLPRFRPINFECWAKSSVFTPHFAQKTITIPDILIGRKEAFDDCATQLFWHGAQ